MGNLKKKQQLVMLYVVYPKKDKKLQNLISRLLKAKSVVCANIIEGMESQYIWKNKVETAKEVVVLFKVKISQVNEVSEIIEKNHPYEVPFVGLIELKQVNSKYLQYAYLST